MALLDIPATCQSSHSYTCAAVYDATHNEFLAHTAAWLIGKPLAIVCLLLFGIALRWVAHRTIDRLVKRAEAGVLPGRFTPSLGRSHEAESTIGASRRVQRAKSLGGLLKSLASGII